MLLKKHFTSSSYQKCYDDNDGMNTTGLPPLPLPDCLTSVQHVRTAFLNDADPVHVVRAGFVKNEKPPSIFQNEKLRAAIEAKILYMSVRRSCYLNLSRF